VNKQQFLQALECRFLDDQYYSFDAIPEALRDTEVIIKWMQTSVHHSRFGSNFALKKIPKRLVNDEIRKEAIVLGAHALEYIHPDDTKIYLELVLQATKAHWFAYKLIHERFKTRETLQAIVDHDPRNMALSHDGQAWIAPLLTQDMIDRVGAISYPFARSVGLQNVAWPSLKKMLAKNSYYYYELVDREGDGLLVKMIQEGGWPDEVDGLRSSKPKGLFQLVGLISQCDKDSNHYRLYCAHLKTFPVNHVIKVMSSPDRREILRSIYPPEVLLAHAKNNRALKAELLEDALGL
jgi:hypothetical protein